ncbi:MAG: hypothetical protein AAF546_10180 [Verrucomicrobiota bacterium]
MNKTKKIGIVLPVIGILAIPLAFLLSFTQMNKGIGPGDGAGLAAMFISLAVAFVITVPSLVVGAICLFCKDKGQRE